MPSDFKAEMDSTLLARKLNELRPDLCSPPSVSSDVLRIYEIIRDGFPKPTGSVPSFPNFHHHDEIDGFDHWSHEAVNVNDPSNRETMRGFVIHHLLHGFELPLSARAWLIYVLEELVDIPHRSKGAPIQGRQKTEFLMKLVGFLDEDYLRSPNSKVTERLKLASTQLCVSYEKVRQVYYSKQLTNFRGFLKNRRNNPG